MLKIQKKNLNWPYLIISGLASFSVRHQLRLASLNYTAYIYITGTLASQEIHRPNVSKQ